MAEVGSAYLTILPSFRGGAKAISQQLDGVNVGKQLGDDVGSGLGAVAKKAVAPLAAALGAISIGAFVKDTITAAGNLEQSIGAVDAVFKTSADQVHAWAQGASQSVGLTEDSFNNFAAVLGSQLKNGGTDLEDLGPKVNDLITLGADLSSMFGGTTSEAVDALSSALRGERDPIERYGISLTQAAIDAEAAALGFEKTGGSLSTQAQQAATLSLLMKQAGDAQGNFARESDTLQGSQQRLSAGWDNLKATIGQAFLPAATGAVSALASFMPAANEGANALVQFSTKVGAALAPIGQAFSDAGGGFAGLQAAAQTAFDMLVDWLTNGGIQQILDGLLAGRERLFDAALQIFPAILDAAMAVIPELISWLTGTAIPGLIATVTTLVPELVTLISELVPQIATTLTTLLPMLLQSAVTLFTSLLTAVTTVLPMLLTTIIGILPSILTTIVGMIPQLLTAGIQAFMTLVQALLTIIPTLLTTLLGTVLPQLLTTILGMLPQLLTVAVEAFFALVQAILTILPQLITVLLTDVLPTLIETILGMIPTLLLTAIDLFLALVTAIADALPQIVSALVGILPVLTSSLLTLVPRLIPAALEMFLALVTGLAQAVPDILAALWDLGQSIIESLGEIDLVEIGKDLIRGLMDGVGQIAGDLIAAVKKPVEDAVNGVKDFLGIHSPSRLFKEIGVNTMLGLTGGIDSEGRRLDKSMSGVAQRMEVGVRPQIENGAAGAGASNGVPLIQQTINPTPGMSETQVGDIAGRRAASALAGVVIQK